MDDFDLGEKLLEDQLVEKNQCDDPIPLPDDKYMDKINPILRK